MKITKWLLMHLILLQITVGMVASAAAVYSYDSHPTGFSVTGGLTARYPANACDEDLNSYAEVQYGSVESGYISVESFSTTGAPTSWSISSVDFKMRYEVPTGGGRGEYRILYRVDPSLTEVVLQDWTNVADALAIRNWTNQVESNDGSWTWTDVANIRFIVDTRQVGSGPSRWFYEYEAWVTVRTQAVGGVAFPVDKLALLAPYVALAVAVVAVAIGAVYSRKRWLEKAVLPRL